MWKKVHFNWIPLFQIISIGLVEVSVPIKNSRLKSRSRAIANHGCLFSCADQTVDTDIYLGKWTNKIRNKKGIITYEEKFEFREKVLNPFNFALQET